MGAFKKAVRAAVKARIALTGPSGAGKSYTALEWAHALGNRIAAVDTEHGSLSTYAGVNGWDFDVIEPSTFDPADLATLAREAGADGYDVFVVDSLSHYWSGPGGMLDLSSKLQRGSDKFSGWSAANEHEKKMIDGLLSFPGHVIVTLRAKNERVIEEDERGKKRVVDVVLKPVQRDGIEYEFGFFAEIDLNHAMTVMKSRISAVPPGSVIESPDGSVARELRDWLANGENLPDPEEFAELARRATVRDELLGLLDQIHRAGLDGAGVLNETGEATALREYVINLGRALQREQYSTAEQVPA